MDIVWSVIICAFCSVLLVSDKKENRIKAIAIILALFMILAFPIAVTI